MSVIILATWCLKCSDSLEINADWCPRCKTDEWIVSDHEIKDRSR